MRTLLLFFLTLLAASAEPPAFYRKVSRMVWVTDDIPRVTAGWAQFGLTGLRSRGDIQSGMEYRGKPAVASLRWVEGRIGDVTVDFVHPLATNDALYDFLRKHGPGIFALVHQTPSREAFDAEIARMRGLGVQVLQRTPEGDEAQFAFFDTVEGGKYSLGIAWLPNFTPPEPGPTKISQFAFVIRDIPPVSAYWEKLGFPAMEVTHPALRDLRHRGKPARYEQDLGWQRHGTVAYEWCVPPKGVPTVYAEYLEKHGEGLQHLGFQVQDLDRAVAEKASAVTQGGAWGEPGKPGSGRFAYLDTDAIGGITVELLWNFKP